MNKITFKRGHCHWKVIYKGAEVGVFHDQCNPNRDNSHKQYRCKDWTFSGVDGYDGRGKTRLLAIANCIKERKRLFSLADVKELNKEAGNYFFSRGAMGFFRSYMETGLLKGGYFVTSEKGEHSARAYTVRKVDYLDGSIDTIGEFEAHRIKEDAKEAIRFDRD